MMAVRTELTITCFIWKHFGKFVEHGYVLDQKIKVWHVFSECECKSFVQIVSPSLAVEGGWLSNSPAPWIPNFCTSGLSAGFNKDFECVIHSHLYEFMCFVFFSCNLIISSLGQLIKSQCTLSWSVECVWHLMGIISSRNISTGALNLAGSDQPVKGEYHWISDVIYATPAWNDGKPLWINERPVATNDTAGWFHSLTIF